MEIKKAGCYLINKENKQVALIYRDKHNDYTFPKGHLESGESLEECAIRETAEETKRVAIILNEYPPIVERYTTPKGEECVCYMYLSIDNGHSDNTSTDTHDVIWTDIDKVESTLSYEGLKKSWASILDSVYEILNS